MWIIILTCVLVSFVPSSQHESERVIVVKLDRVSRHQGQCILSDLLDLKMTSVKTIGGVDWSDKLQLYRSEARHSVDYVYVMQQDMSGRFYLQSVSLDTSENQQVERYYNHVTGACITVRCTLDDHLHQAVYKFEGSLFFKGVKYLLTPYSGQLYGNLTQSQSNVYVLKKTVEYNAADSAWSQGRQRDTRILVPPKVDEGEKQRAKRQTPVTYHIDMLPVVDVSMFNRWSSGGKTESTTLQEITNYISNILTSVNMRLQTLSLENYKLQVHLLPPIYSKDSSSSTWNSGIVENENGQQKIEASKLLTAFKNYLGSNSSLKYDHAFLLTAYDIYGGNDQGIKYNITKGLAYVSTICSTAGDSSSIIEDKGGYQSEGVLTHELGHSLGSKHDGDSNTCLPTDRYIMSDSNYPASQNNAFNPWQYSTCSSAAILAKLKAMQSDTKELNCLTDKIGQDVNSSIAINPNDQCRSIYGGLSFACRGEGFPNISSVCQDFYCRIPSKQTCERITAATGTCCGKQMKCNQGKCEPTSTGECPLDESCPFDDQPGDVTVVGQNCSAAPSGQCYKNDFNSKCCKTCQSRKTNISSCEYGDKSSGCDTSLCNSTDANGNSYDFFCCKTCSLTTVHETNVTYNNRTYDCSSLVQLFTASVCNKPEVHKDYCPVTCEMNRDKNHIDCPWGDKNNCTLLNMSATVETKCSEAQARNCCKTCDDIAQRTTTSTTTTTSKATTKPPTVTQTCKTAPCTAAFNFQATGSLVLVLFCWWFKTLFQ